MNLPRDDNLSVGEENVEAPLLKVEINPAVIHRRHTPNEDLTVRKKWRSLETVSRAEEAADAKKKKLVGKPSIRGWIVGLFNGNGIRTSNTSLPKAVLPEYNSLQQPEKESIV